MGYQIKTKGIVLHEMPIGDYDKRLIILTKEQGKVTAFVKGARRSNNRMLASTQIFAYGEYVLYRGKSSFNVQQGELIEHFHRLRLDIEDLTYAMFLLEFVDFVASEEMENQSLMKLLLYALNTIDKERMNTRLTVQTFLLKAMSIIGFTPWVNNCAICNKEENLSFFSPDSGGLICDDVTHIVKDKIKVSPATIHAIRYTLSRKTEEIFSYEIEGSYLTELEYLMHQYVKQHLNHHFKTLDFLKTI